jgi:hypothetical protein
MFQYLSGGEIFKDRNSNSIIINHALPYKNFGPIQN